MMINLKEISPATIEKFFNSTLPLLTGLKYITKIRKIQQRDGCHPIMLDLEITESPLSSPDYEKLRENFEAFIDRDNFVKRYQNAKKM